MSSPSQMEIFVEVVRQEGFTAAAKTLNVSKSHVSKQIDRLEERLGVRLLHRTTRQVSITEVGQTYFDRCVQILADIRDAEQTVGELQSSPTGTLRITAPMTFGLKYLNPLIFDFLKQYPGLDVEVLFSDQLVDLVSSGVDVGVRIGDLRDSSLIARQLAPVKVFPVASPEYLEIHGEPRHPEELRDHSCLRYSYQVSGTTWQFSGEDGETMVKVEGRIIANNGQALADAAREGLGIGLAPDFIVSEEIRSGDLVPILQDWEVQELALWVVYPHRRFLSRKVRLFVDYIAEAFSGEPPWATS